MDYPACNVIYVDKRATRERYQLRGSPDTASQIIYEPNSIELLDNEVKEVQLNLRALLSVFTGVQVCTTGQSCVAKVRELDAAVTDACKPTLVILHVYTDLDIQAQPKRREQLSSSSASPTANRNLTASPDLEDLYSIQLLQYISNEIAYSNYSKLILPVAMASNLEGILASDRPTPGGRPTRPASNSFNPLGPDSANAALDSEVYTRSAPVAPKRMMKCLNAGAVDVITSPLDKARISGLIAHVYRAHKESLKDQAAFLATMRQRKRSWVGMDNDVPYAYLRESMVSHLMTSICKPESVLQTYDARNMYTVDRHQEVTISHAISRWDFSAHDFSEDELVHAAFLMLQHALQLPALEKWRLPTEDLKTFLMACRAAYNGFVLYHNFKHVVDVLQAVFYFLLQLGTLPPYPPNSASPPASKPLSPIAALLQPFDALTLLVSAIGHDVGHPGVNNAFLVALKAPLAQLYNDNSVLEAFHCAAYSQILRRYWKVAFEDTNMRKLLITSILATDMGVHFKYMADLGNLQSKLHDNEGTDGWSPQVLNEYKTLTCGLLIKCADISNVARPFSIAAKWSDILQLEFSRQGEMETEVGIPTTLFGGPPELGNLTKLANSQLGFMNIFAHPLFEAVTDILPGMAFAIREIKENQSIWKSKVDSEKSKELFYPAGTQSAPEGRQSPRSGSPDRLIAASPVASHPEGLPASGSTPSLPASPPMNTSQSVPDFVPAYPTSSSLPGLASISRSAPPSQSPSSRQSPSGLPGGNPGIQPDPTPEAISYSRRSSNAYPSIISSRRRSSNTLPTQLQPHLSDSHPLPVSENTQPLRPDNMLFSAVDVAAKDGFASGPRPYGSGSTGASASSGRARVEKSGDGDDYSSYPLKSGGTVFSTSHSGRHSAQQSSGRYSALSQDRFSNATSGAQTLASHALPNSPTDTQATSFLTEGSDNGFGDEESVYLKAGEWNGRERVPSTISSSYTMGSEGKGMNGHTAVLVGAEGQRSVRKKNSRWRLPDLWRKRKEGTSQGTGGGTGSP